MLAARYSTLVDSLTGKVAPVERGHQHLQHLLYRFLRYSRAETPDGSLPACAEDHVASRLNPYPPHYKAAFACSILLYPQPYRLTLRLAFPSGRATGLPRSVSVPTWGRSSLSAGGLPLRPVTLEHRFLTPYLLVQASSHLPLISHHDAFSHSPLLTIPCAPRSRPPRCWQSPRRLTLS
jgi:hypothetical protein